MTSSIPHSLIRNVEKEGGDGGREGDYMPVSLHCHHQNDSCITEIGSDESYFNVSLTVRGKVTK